MPKRRRSGPATAEIRARVRQAGLRSTAPRVAVLSEMLESPTPVSHAELAERLADRGFDRATIYRNLTDLTEVGVLARLDLGDHVWRFELRERAGEPNPPAHPHFLCTDCGTVECLPSDAIRITTKPRMPRAVRGADVEVQLKGRCDACAA